MIPILFLPSFSYNNYKFFCQQGKGVSSASACYHFYQEEMIIFGPYVAFDGLLQSVSAISLSRFGLQ